MKGTDSLARTVVTGQKGNGLKHIKLKSTFFVRKIKKKMSFTVRVVRYWNRLSRMVVDATSL